jgi:hypothetical protein
MDHRRLKKNLTYYTNEFHIFQASGSNFPTLWAAFPPESEISLGLFRA